MIPPRPLDPGPGSLAEVPPCAGCGRCCHLTVVLQPGDRVADALVVEHAGVRCLNQRSNGACVALDERTQLCTIYEDRPQTCRDFARGGSLCRWILAAPARSRREAPAPTP